jgi:hypothetical protein
MKRIVLLALVLVAAFVLFKTSVAQAQGPLPPNDLARGLVYDGLQVATEGECKGGFKVLVPGATGLREQCTHGPDPAPPTLRVSQIVAPLQVTQPTTVMCDGDGVSGKRMQVLYARAADTPSRYATYLASFQQWAAEVDAAFRISASHTGGDRRVRFVTDANCIPTVTEVVTSSWGTQSFGNTISELASKGFNRTDRKYLVFMDARVYCGIASTENDDSPGPGNKSNTGPHYGRIDAGCWSSALASHELMHTLGAVQLSAPNSDGNWHCKDGYDNMCNYGGRQVQIVCTDPKGSTLFDCNHEDYFNTDPAANSYLAKRWNTANNQFLIAPTAVRVDSFVTGKLLGNNFLPTSVFGSGDVVALRIHVVDQNNADLSDITVNYNVYQPNESTQCTLSGTSDAKGIIQGLCPLPANAPSGTWRARIASVARAASNLAAGSITEATFTVYAPTAVTLSSFTARAVEDTAFTKIWMFSGLASVCVLMGGLILSQRISRKR